MNGGSNMLYNDFTEKLLGLQDKGRFKWNYTALKHNSPCPWMSGLFCTLWNYTTLKPI